MRAAIFLLCVYLFGFLDGVESEEEALFGGLGRLDTLGRLQSLHKTPTPLNSPTASPLNGKTNPKSINPISISPKSISPNSISPKSISPNSISPKSISPNSISPNSISPNSISPKSISPNSISPNSISPNSISPNSINISPQGITPSSLDTKADSPTSLIGSSPKLPKHSHGCEDSFPSDPALRCAWAETCMNDESLIPYAYLYFCKVPVPSIGIPLIILWCTFLCILAAMIADEYLTSLMLEISNSLKISEAVAGCTILAFGNSSGDTLLGYWSCFAAEPKIDLFIGDAVGSVSLLTTVVFGLVVIAAGCKGIQLDRGNCIRDSVFIVLAICALLVHITYPNWELLFAFSTEANPRLLSAPFHLFLVFLYCCYVLTIIIQARYVRKAKSCAALLDSTDTADTSKAPMTYLCDGDDTAPLLIVPIEEAKPSSKLSQIVAVASLKEEACIGDRSLSLPASPRIEASLFSTRVGKRILSTQGIMADPRCRSELVATEHPGRAAYRLSQNLMPFSRGWQASDFPQKSRMDQLKRFIYRSLNDICCLVAYPWKLMWKLTIPSPEFDATLMAGYPFFIVSIILFTHLHNFQLIPFLSIWGCAAAVSLAMFAFPNVLTLPWRDNFTLSHLRLFLGICLSLKWNVALVAELVKAVKTIALIIGVPVQVLGLTLVAWSNSLADLFANVAIATSGHPEMGLAGCYGAAIFTNLFGLGSVGLLSAAVGNYRGQGSMWFTVDTATYLVLKSLAVILPIQLLVSIYYKFRFVPAIGLMLIASYVVLTVVAVANH